MNRLGSHDRSRLFRRICSIIICSAFITNVVLPPRLASAQAFTQTVLGLPVPGTMVSLSNAFIPPLLKGIQIDPQNPLMFNFIVDTGRADMPEAEVKENSMKLIKYFMASLTVPEEELWVNLSPYEGDRIIPTAFGATEMGRDLLAQDYMLKQLTASLVYPEQGLGKEFWERVYERAQKEYGTTDIPMNTFNKIWITPERASVIENEKGAFIVDSHLKVMLEEDYIALQNNMGVEKFGLDHATSDEAKIYSGITSEVVRNILIPEIEKEVNQGKTFVQLRQIYSALILASWYKVKLKDSLLGQIYADKNKTKGIENDDAAITEKIYQQYLEAFNKGVYDYIKEDYDPATQEIIPRKYFSGGFVSKIGEEFKSTAVGMALLFTTLIGPTFDSQAMDQRINDVGKANKNIVSAYTGFDPNSTFVMGQDTPSVKEPAQIELREPQRISDPTMEEIRNKAPKFDDGKNGPYLKPDKDELERQPDPKGIYHMKDPKKIEPPLVTDRLDLTLPKDLTASTLTEPMPYIEPVQLPDTTEGKRFSEVESSLRKSRLKADSLFGVQNFAGALKLYEENGLQWRGLIKRLENNGINGISDDNLKKTKKNYQRALKSNEKMMVRARRFISGIPDLTPIKESYNGESLELIKEYNFQISVIDWGIEQGLMVHPFGRGYFEEVGKKVKELMADTALVSFYYNHPAAINQLKTVGDWLVSEAKDLSENPKNMEYANNAVALHDMESYLSYGQSIIGENPRSANIQFQKGKVIGERLKSSGELSKADWRKVGARLAKLESLLKKMGDFSLLAPTDKSITDPKGRAIFYHDRLRNLSLSMLRETLEEKKARIGIVNDLQRAIDSEDSDSLRSVISKAEEFTQKYSRQSTGDGNTLREKTMYGELRKYIPGYEIKMEDVPILSRYIEQIQGIQKIMLGGYSEENSNELKKIFSFEGISSLVKDSSFAAQFFEVNQSKRINDAQKLIDSNDPSEVAQGKDIINDYLNRQLELLETLKRKESYFEPLFKVLDYHVRNENNTLNDALKEVDKLDVEELKGRTVKLLELLGQENEDKIAGKVITLDKVLKEEGLNKPGWAEALKDAYIDLKLYTVSIERFKDVIERNIEFIETIDRAALSQDIDKSTIDEEIDKEIYEAEENLGLLTKNIPGYSPIQKAALVTALKEMIRSKQSRIKLEGNLEDLKNANKEFAPFVAKYKEVGGINLNPAMIDMQIKRDGNGFMLPLDQQPLMQMEVDGFLPVIFQITPVTNLPLLLGVNLPDDQNKDPSDTPSLGYMDRIKSEIRS